MASEALKGYRRRYAGSLVGMRKRKYALVKTWLGRGEFDSWAAGEGEYVRLYYGWVRGGRRRVDSPTVVRVDSSHAWGIGNLKWVRYEESAREARIRQPGNEYRGVRKYFGRFRAMIVKDKKTVHIGMFDTKEEAAMAYDRWAVKIYGRKINYPD